MIKFITNTGDTDWFEIDGITYGVSTDNEIMDDEGHVKDSDFLNQNWELVDSLIAAKEEKK